MNNYFIQYTSKSFESPREYRTYKSSPVMALNDFHRAMQRTREIDGKRKVTRPRMKPDEYKIVRMFIRYSDAARALNPGTTIESEFDIPNTPNPDLKYNTKKVKKADKPKPQETAEFVFTSIP